MLEQVRVEPRTPRRRRRGAAAARPSSWPRLGASCSGRAGIVQARGGRRRRVSIRPLGGGRRSCPTAARASRLVVAAAPVRMVTEFRHVALGGAAAGALGQAGRQSGAGVWSNTGLKLPTRPPGPASWPRPSWRAAACRRWVAGIGRRPQVRGRLRAAVRDSSAGGRVAA